MIACVLLPRLELLAALGRGRRELVARPVALAPEPGGPQVIGAASGAAEAFGIRAGMRLAEALARCPRLMLVPPDAERAETAWEEVLRRLEGIGAEVECRRPGEAFFAVDGLRPLWGGTAGGVLARAARAVGVGSRGDDDPQAVPRGARLGTGPSRLCAYAAARRARARGGPVRIPSSDVCAFLASLPVGILRERLEDEWERAVLPDQLERLGVRTLGELAALPRAAIADRFGERGLRALRMARGEEEPLRPRRRHDRLLERLELPEPASGTQLERALELLIDRLLANPTRRRRGIRRLRISARLAGGGSWRTEVTLRRAGAGREGLRLALLPKLSELPGPAQTLELSALEMGAEAQDQLALDPSPAERRRKLLAEAVRQARAAGGRDAVLRITGVEPTSRVPERRILLAPWQTHE